MLRERERVARGEGGVRDRHVRGADGNRRDDGPVLRHDGAVPAGNHHLDGRAGVVGEGQHGGVVGVAEERELHGEAPAGGRQGNSVLGVGGADGDRGPLGEEELGRRDGQLERGGEDVEEGGVEREGGGVVQEGEELEQEGAGAGGGEQAGEDGEDGGVLGQQDDELRDEGVVRHQRLAVPRVCG